MTDFAKAAGPLSSHPRGLLYLGFTEAWERFSYYGMSALLVLYMEQTILTPSRISGVAGLEPLRHIIEAITGPLTRQAFGSQLFGLYSGLVYLTPMLGGLIADRALGARRTVALGAILLCCGHFAMAFDASFLLALCFLILGSGCLKGNISAQVGRLYPADDEARRVRGYVLFSMAINIGSIAGPLACGMLAEIYGWHAGFSLAGAMMLMGLIIYVAGFPYLPADLERRSRHDPTVPPLSHDERRRILWLFAVLLIAVFPSATQGQVFNVGQIWTKTYVDLQTRFGSIPIPWFNSVDAGFGVLGTPLMLALWRFQQRQGREPNPLAKISIGAILLSSSSLLLVLGTSFATAGGKISPIWPIAGYAMRGFAFIWYWPAVLALVSQATPARLNATLLSASFLALFAGNIIVGAAGAFYGRLGATHFWLMDALIPQVGVLIVLIFGRSISAGLLIDRI